MVILICMKTIFAGLLLGLPLLAETVPFSEFRERRAAIRQKLGEGVLVLYGATLDEHQDNRSGFFQEPNFYYLTGQRDPGGILLLTAHQERLYRPRRDSELIKWHGGQLWAEDDIEAATGIPGAPVDCFPEDLQALQPARVLTLPRSREAVAKLAPAAAIEDALPIIRLRRMKKSPAELRLITRAVEATIAGQRAAWKVIAPGKYEYQLGAAITYAYLERGCERHAFAPSLASGPNGLVLHYSRNDRRLQAGELLIIDTGAECMGYTADLTRTIPVSGRFTPRQRELYQAVLAARRAILAAARPGVTFQELRQVAVDSLNAEAKDLGRYLTHGVSHHVGLEVHDAADNRMPLEAGAVITVEPGVYLPGESVGIRIEDMIVITPSGGQLLSGALPVEAAEVERAMAARRP